MLEDEVGRVSVVGVAGATPPQSGDQIVPSAGDEGVVAEQVELFPSRSKKRYNQYAMVYENEGANS